MELKDFIVVKCERCGRLKVYNCPRKFGQLKDYKIACGFLTINPVMVNCLNCTGLLMHQVDKDNYTSKEYGAILNKMMEDEGPAFEKAAFIGTYMAALMKKSGISEDDSRRVMNRMAESFAKYESLGEMDIIDDK